MRFTASLSPSRCIIRPQSGTQGPRVDADRWIELLIAAFSAAAAIGAWVAAKRSADAAHDANLISSSVAAAERARQADAIAGTAHGVYRTLDDVARQTAGTAAFLRADLPRAKSPQQEAYELEEELRAHTARESVQALGADVLRELDAVAFECKTLWLVTANPKLALLPDQLAVEVEKVARRAHAAADTVARLVPGVERKSFEDLLRWSATLATSLARGGSRVAPPPAVP